MRTREFTARFMDLVAAARRDPARPIVIVSYDPVDYDPIWSLQRFRHTYRVTNPRFLYVAWDEQHSSATPLARKLAQDIPRLVEARVLDFEPIDGFRPDRHRGQSACS
jgi:hypothetical protein